jgi:hypothetical protein
MTSERPALIQAHQEGRKVMGEMVRGAKFKVSGLKVLGLGALSLAFVLAGCQTAPPASPPSQPVRLAAAQAAPEPAPQAEQQAAIDGPIDLSAAHWSHLPNGAQIASLYPSEAAKTKLSGYALVHCQVRSSGALENCEALVERPAGFGFGDATVRAAQYFKLAAGAYGPNASVDVPFSWALR